MRTNIEIDDELMKKAMKSSGAATKKEVVDTALRMLVRTQDQSGMRKFWGKVKWDGNLDEMRRD